MGKVGRAFRVLWRGANALSTIQWLWGLLPAGAVAVIASILARAEHLPPIIIGVVAFAAFALAYLVYVGWRIERLQTQPNLIERARERSLQNKADLITDITSGRFSSDRRHETFGRSELGGNRAREAKNKRSDWLPLHQVLHWLVYDSQWGAGQPPVKTEEEFNRVVSAEIRERIARGDIASRGQFGWEERSRERATEPIPAKYWIDAFFLPYAAIALADRGGDEVAKQGGGGAVYRGVILRWQDVKNTWSGGRSADAPLTALAAFVEPARAKIVAEGLQPGSRGVLTAMEDEAAEQQERAWLRLQTILSPDKVKRVRAGKYRDVSLAEALGWAVYGEWGKPWHGTPITAALAAGLGIGADIYELLVEFRKRASNGNLTVWGKTSSTGVWKEIPASHWDDHELTLADTFGSITTGEHGYRDLMLSRAQVEGEWRHEG